MSSPQTSVIGASQLEGMPRLCEKVVVLWGTPEFDVFANHLLMDTRDGSRQGLPVDVAAEVLALIDLNRARRAHERSAQGHMSYEEAYRLIDNADRQRLETDKFDDPLVSHDTIERGHQAPDLSANVSTKTATSAVSHTPEGGVSGPFSLIGYALVSLLRKPWLIALVIIALGLISLWPNVKPLLHLLTGK